MTNTRPDGPDQLIISREKSECLEWLTPIDSRIQLAFAAVLARQIAEKWDAELSKLLGDTWRR